LPAQERRVADDGIEAWPRWIENLGKYQRPMQCVPVEGAVELIGI